MAEEVRPPTPPAKEGHVYLKHSQGFKDSVELHKQLAAEAGSVVGTIAEAARRSSEAALRRSTSGSLLGTKTPVYVCTS